MNARPVITKEKKQSPLSLRQRIAGHSARALSAFAVAFSFSLFLNEGLSAGLSHGQIALFCALGSLITCLLLSPPFGTVGGGLCLIGAGVGGYLFFRGRFQVIGYAVSAFFNACSRALFLKNNDPFPLPDRILRDLDLGEKDCFRIGMIFAVLLLAFFFALCLFRKTHLIPLLIVSLGLLTAEISFGMRVSVFSFLLCCSSLAGCFALFHADRAAKKQKEKRRRVLSGFSGLFTIFLTFLFLLPPALLIKEPMRQNPSVASVEEKAERFLNDLFSGKIRFGGEKEQKLTEKRDTYASERNPGNDKHYEIRLAVETPVYLREWVGKNFSDDAWLLPTDEECEVFFDTFGRGFSPELLTAELLRALDPPLIELGAATSVSHTDLGYYLARVSVKNLTGEKNLAGLPSFVDPTAGVIGEADGKTPDARFYAYCDGIFRWAEGSQTSSYTVNARLTRTQGRAFGKQLSELISEAKEEFSYIRFFRRNGLLPADGYELLSEEEKESFGTDSLLFRYCFEMDRDEQSHVLAVIDNLALYDDYVYENYLGLCGGAHEIGSLAKQIIRRDKALDPSADLTDAEFRDLAVRSVIKYLSSEMSYTFSPRVGSENYLNSVYEFLFESKEGYCVQYASAATMLLRSLGIPTRYCEGYFATSFSEDPTAGREGKYAAVMTGKNAHAWIEVYFDGFGWITYETTKPFVSYVSDLPAIETVPETDRFGESRPETKPKDPGKTDEQTLPESKRTTIETRPPEEEISKTDSVLPRILPFLLIAGGLIACGILFQKSADTAGRASGELLKTAADREKTGALTPSERSSLADRLTGLLFRLFAYAGCKPSVGEQPSDFLARTWKQLEKTEISEEVTEAVLSGDFNPDPSPEELAVLAGAAEELFALAVKKRGRGKTFVWTYFVLPGYWRKIGKQKQNENRKG